MTNRHNPPTTAELTTAELADFAVQDGALTHGQVEVLRATHHNDNMLRSALAFTNRHGLHRRMDAGTLTLCTRRQWPCPVHPGK